MTIETSLRTFQLEAQLLVSTNISLVTLAGYDCDPGRVKSGDGKSCQRPCHPNCQRRFAIIAQLYIEIIEAVKENRTLQFAVDQQSDSSIVLEWLPTE